MRPRAARHRDFRFHAACRIADRIAPPREPDRRIQRNGSTRRGFRIPDRIDCRGRATHCIPHIASGSLRGCLDRRGRSGRRRCSMLRSSPSFGSREQLLRQCKSNRSKGFRALAERTSPIGRWSSRAVTGRLPARMGRGRFRDADWLRPERSRRPSTPAELLRDLRAGAPRAASLHRRTGSRRACVVVRTRRGPPPDGARRRLQRPIRPIHEEPPTTPSAAIGRSPGHSPAIRLHRTRLGQISCPRVRLERI